LKDFKDRPVMARLKKPPTEENILSSLYEGSDGMPSFKTELTQAERISVTKYLLSRQ